MPREIRDSVVVITGASSGIGRATALAFARRGAAVVVAARREQVLREVAAQCEALGGWALAVPTDVTDEGAVQEMARRAVENFGRIDVWVNNAASNGRQNVKEHGPEGRLSRGARAARLGIAGLSLVGVADALYMLAYDQGLIDSLVCPFFGEGCNIVGRSEHAKHFGVPNAAGGILGYAAMA